MEVRVMAFGFLERAMRLIRQDMQDFVSLEWKRKTYRL
jgi:hypothetical protein